MSLESHSNPILTGPGKVERDARCRFFSNSLAVILALIVLAAVINWPYQYAVASSTRGSTDSTVDFRLSTRDLPVMAGWPFRYLVSYSHSGGADSKVRRFSGGALLSNVALAGLVIAGGASYFRRREARGVVGKAAKGRFSIADILVLCATLAMILGLWQSVNTGHRRNLDLSDRIVRSRGAQVNVAWAPRVLADWLPNSLLERMRRIRAVRIEDPPAELIERIVDQCDLTSLRTSGGGYKLQLLERLADNPHLHDLRISERTINAQTLRWIASNPRIDSLNLMWSNLPDTLFDNLPMNLERLNLLHSDAALEEIGSPAASKSLRELLLGRPGPGVAWNVSIDGWPRLERLIIFDPWAEANSTSMSVHLANLPSLERVGLGEFQRFELTLRNLPKLRIIDQERRDLNNRPLPPGMAVPDAVWLARFDAQGLPEFETLRLFGVDTSYLRILDSPKFRLMQVSDALRTSGDPIHVTELPAEVVRAIVDGISESDGPTVVDLSMLPLANANLASLTNNRRLERILLSKSKTNRTHWEALARMSWLKSLDVRDCPIDQHGVRWVLETFPNLEHCAFSLEKSVHLPIDSFALEVVNHPNIRKIDFGIEGSGYLGTELIERVRVIEAPSLETPLLMGPVQEVEVHNAQSLTGISIREPFQTHFKVSGLRDLRFFAVGGPNVHDGLIASLEPCTELRTLTLAYPNVSESTLTIVGRFEKLTSLNLPGSTLNDAVILGWPQFSELRHLDIRDTRVTGAGLKRLISGGKISRLVLNHSSVTSEDLDTLSECRELSELMLAGIGIESENLAAIFANQSLKQLDLSDSELKPAIFDQLIDGGETLEFLVLRNCEIDDRKLTALARKYPLIQFDLNGSTASGSVITQLLVSERIVEVADRNILREMQRRYTAVRAGISLLDKLPPSIIDIEPFAEMRQAGNP